MVYKINTECINCDACETVCPCGAISKENAYYKIDIDKCNECIEYFDEPKCISICPAHCIEMTSLDES